MRPVEHGTWKPNRPKSCATFTDPSTQKESPESLHVKSIEPYPRYGLFWRWGRIGRVLWKSTLPRRIMNLRPSSLHACEPRQFDLPALGTNHSHPRMPQLFWPSGSDHDRNLEWTSSPGCLEQERLATSTSQLPQEAFKHRSGDLYPTPGPRVSAAD